MDGYPSGRIAGYRRKILEVHICSVEVVRTYPSVS